MLKLMKDLTASMFAQRRKRLLVAAGGAPSGWYDDAYSGSVDEYMGSYTDSRYLPVWEAICARISQGSSVLEVGCGPGQLARMLHDRGVLGDYVGFDFSPQAIALAKRNLPEIRLEVGDARTTDLFTTVDYGSVICTEVLEHIVDDLLVIQRIPSGKQVLATVPDFDYESHVRYFSDAERVNARYAPFFTRLDISTHHHAGDANGHHGTFFLLNGITK